MVLATTAAASIAGTNVFIAKAESASFLAIMNIGAIGNLLATLSSFFLDIPVQIFNLSHQNDPFHWSVVLAIGLGLTFFAIFLTIANR